LKIRRTRWFTLFVGTCIVLALSIPSNITAIDVVSVFVETGYITNDGWLEHYITIPAGPEVKIELIWEDPPDDRIDLDFYELGWTVKGASLNNPEIAFLSDITEPLVLGIGVHGFGVPGDGVDYQLIVTVGPDVIPDPYADPGGLSVGDLTGWFESARIGSRSADDMAGITFHWDSNPYRQTIMPWYGWDGNPYEGSGWSGATFYAGDALLVGGPAFSWDMADYTLREAQRDLATYTIQYRIDGIPLESLGVVIESPIRPDFVKEEWYLRLPRVFFKPGEFIQVLGQPPEYLHSFEFILNGNIVFMDYFYLV